MLHRRTLLATPLAALAAPAAAQAPRPQPVAKPDSSFLPYIEGVKAEALKAGIRQATLDSAFRGIRSPNAKVIELDRRQPEFTLTWAQYRQKVISDARIARGRENFTRHRALIDQICARYRLHPSPLMGIWGLESGYGQFTGGFNVIESLATLAWEGRRAAFFRAQLLNALKIINAGDIPAARMSGSYAGAMGQPQFMPDSFLRFAVDWDGDGHRDLWNSTGDILASIANYLAKSGWTPPLASAQQLDLPRGFDPSLAGRDKRRPLAEWARLGIRPRGAVPGEAQAAVILPDGAGGEAFLAWHPNFAAIRRYNPSDYYALAVGLIGDAVTGT
ncbi:MAG: lytic murein transglycosylase [Acetobacteraceae bacterium]|nr:lytic murein transglycosylase [Acetobacteraceae bacterium]